MSYNGAGVFSITTAGQPVVTGTVISSTAFNALTADLATGLSTAITKDGQTTTTVRVPFAAGISSALVTDATSTTTGSITSAGGISCQKNLWVGTGAYIPNLGGANKIINGDMRIDQRNAGASVTPTTSAYTLDRWGFGASVTSKASIQQNAAAVTPPAGFTYYLGVTSLSSYSVGAAEQFAIYQSVEGLNCADLSWGGANAKSITISFWVRSSLTGSFGGAVRNSAVNRSYPFSYTISSANTWEQKTVTLAGDTSGTWLTTTGTGLVLSFGLGVGSTLSGTASAWAAGNYASVTSAVSVVGTNAATWYVTGVKLEVGSIATPFVPDDYAVSLEKCERYFQSWASDVQMSIAWGQTPNATSAQWYLALRTSMRGTPTLTTAGTISAYNPAIAIYTITPTLSNIDKTFGLVQLSSGTISGGAFVTGGSASIILNSSGAYIRLDAEL